MDCWYNWPLVVWAFLVIVLHSSLWFIWNNCICKILSNNTSMSSNIRNCPIIHPILYHYHYYTIIIITLGCAMSCVTERGLVPGCWGLGWAGWLGGWTEPSFLAVCTSGDAAIKNRFKKFWLLKPNLKCNSQRKISKVIFMPKWSTWLIKSNSSLSAEPP